MAAAGNCHQNNRTQKCEGECSQGNVCIPLSIRAFQKFGRGSNVTTPYPDTTDRKFHSCGCYPRSRIPLNFWDMLAGAEARQEAQRLPGQMRIWPREPESRYQSDEQDRLAAEEERLLAEAERLKERTRLAEAERLKNTYADEEKIGDLKVLKIIQGVKIVQDMNPLHPHWDSRYNFYWECRHCGSLNHGDLRSFGRTGCRSCGRHSGTSPTWGKGWWADEKVEEEEEEEEEAEEEARAKARAEEEARADHEEGFNCAEEYNLQDGLGEEGHRDRSWGRRCSACDSNHVDPLTEEKIRPGHGFCSANSCYDSGEPFDDEYGNPVRGTFRATLLDRKSHPVTQESMTVANLDAQLEKGDWCTDARLVEQKEPSVVSPRTQQIEDDAKLAHNIRVGLKSPRTQLQIKNDAKLAQNIRVGVQPNEEQKEEVCAICQESANEDDGPLDAFCDSCGRINHYMHTFCLNQWLARNKNNCPICKGSPCKPQHVVDELVDESNILQQYAAAAAGPLAPDVAPYLRYNPDFEDDDDSALVYMDDFDPGM